MKQMKTILSFSRASSIHRPPARLHVGAYIKSRAIHPHQLAITSSARVTSYNNHRVSQRQRPHPTPSSPFPPIVPAGRPLLPLSTCVYVLTRGPAALRMATRGLKASLGFFYFCSFGGALDPAV